MFEKKGCLIFFSFVLICSLPVVSDLFAQGGVSFIAPRDFFVGRYPRSIIVADFNGDDLQDMAMVNGGASYYNPDSTVSILLGNGDGTFASAQNLEVGRQPTSLTVDDFNGDKIPDLAVIMLFPPGPSTVWILLGNGDGTLGLPQGFALGRSSSSLALGDFNGDEIPDLAVANVSSNSVSILLGRGDGTFGPPQSFDIGIAPGRVLADDFNGDGHQDLVSTGRLITFLPGQGNGTFGSNESFIGVGDSSRIGDFNGDGRPDLAIVNSASDTVSILINDSQ